MFARDRRLRWPSFSQPLFQYLICTAIAENKVLHQLLRAPLLRVTRRMELHSRSVKIAEHLSIRFLNGRKR